MNKISLEDLGWGEPFESAFIARGKPRETPGRVMEEQRGAYLVQTETGHWLARISGRLRHEAKKRIDFPTVGDWVSVNLLSGEKKATLLAILPRTSTLCRKATGHESDDQYIAANLNTVFVVTSLNKDFSLRRLERYLALVASSGARAVVLLSKADLAAEPETSLRDVKASLPGVTVLAVSATTGYGLEALDPYLKKGETVALIGSSGVGKSTLINRLSGSTHLVQDIRTHDDSGRHTTTFRRLVPLPQGGLLIDTPGMRELQMTASQGVADTFTDILDLIAACQFHNCHHLTDIGCAVQAAIQKGSLASGRYAHYVQLQKETNDQLLAQEHEAHTKANEKIKRAKEEFKKQRRLKE